MNTKHNAACQMSFGRPSPATGCPRCIELSNGAAPRTWNTLGRRYGYQTDAQRSAEMDRHFASDRHRNPNNPNYCGPICTAFDW